MDDIVLPKQDDGEELTDNRADLLETPPPPRAIVEQGAGGSGKKETSRTAKVSKLPDSLGLNADDVQRQNDAKLIQIRSQLHQLKGSPDEPVVFTKDAPRWQSEEADNWAAKYRGKSNEVVTDARGNYEATFNKSVRRIDGQRDNVAGLQREFAFLQRLQASGVAPEPLLLKINPDGSEARLMMKKVNGKSIEAIDADDEAAKGRFDDIATSVNQAIDIVHKNGILAVDVNEGTFVIDGLGSPGKALTTKVVDFELAEDRAAIASPDAQANALGWYKGRDIAIEMASQQPGYILTDEGARASEQYLAAKVVVEKFVGYGGVDVSSLSSADRERYDNQLEKVRPFLAAKMIPDLKQNYADFGKQYYSTEQEYIDAHLDNDIQPYVNEAMLNITLPYLLREKGITARPETVLALQARLSPILTERSAN